MYASISHSGLPSRTPPSHRALSRPHLLLLLALVLGLSLLAPALVSDLTGSSLLRSGAASSARLAPQRVPCTTLRDARESVLRYLGRGKRWTSLSALAPRELLGLARGVESQLEPRYLLVGDGSTSDGGGGASEAIMRRLCAGGGLGRCTASSSCVARRARVLVLQPVARLAAGLAARAAAGGWAHCGWSTLPLAVGAAAGGSLSLHASGGAGAAVTSVEVTSVDALLAAEGWSRGAPGSLSLLAVDAESGGDPLVLAGAAAALAAKLPRLLLFSFSPQWALAASEAALAAGQPPPSLRAVTRELLGHGYACYLWAPAIWVPLSGAWWSELYEELVWSSIVCVSESDVALITELLSHHTSSDALEAPLPPVSRCALNRTQVVDLTRRRSAGLIAAAAKAAEEAGRARAADVDAAWEVG